MYDRRDFIRRWKKMNLKVPIVHLSRQNLPVPWARWRGGHRAGWVGRGRAWSLQPLEEAGDGPRDHSAPEQPAKVW